MSGTVFSDSWFRIANARVGLLATTKAQRQLFRGKTWYLLQDTTSHKFFRVTPEAYAFLCQLTPERTVEEVWLESIRLKPEEAPGQEEVVRLLSQLHVANMLYFRDLPDNQAIFHRTEKQRRRELRAKAMSFLYHRIYLFNPDPWLNRCPGLIRALTGPLALAVWALVLLRGGATVLENWDNVFDKTQGFFSVGNLPWLYVALTLLKLLHETGHAFVCKRFGGEVRAFGIMFLILTPLPYVDVGTTWTFKNRFQRAAVGAAGMMTELFMAALAAMLWAQTSGGVVHSLAFNVMVIGSVSSLLFNGNPLLRFDAYYILADLVDIPNLYQKAQQQWLYFGDRYLLGTQGAESPATDRREWLWFTVYGLVAFCYRMMSTTGIVLFVLGQWFIVGVVMGAITLATLTVLPLVKLYHHLHSPRVQRTRGRAVAVAAGLGAALLALLFVVPFPSALRAHGVLQAYQSATVHAITDGVLVRQAVAHGRAVKRGDVLAVLSNPDLDYEYETTQQELRESEQLLRQSVFRMPADIVPIEQRIQALQVHLHELEYLRGQLVVRAPNAGVWVAPMLHERQGAWIPRGQALGEIVEGDRYRFVAVVPQEQAEELFRYEHKGADLRLAGQTGADISIRDFTLIPYEKDRLASSALGLLGGGEMPVKMGDQSGEATTESFFQLYAMLPAKPGDDVYPVHGLSGILRIPLPKETLYRQVRRLLQQLFQKRYAV